MKGVARVYCKILAQGLDYRALVSAVDAQDNTATNSLVVKLQEEVERFAANQLAYMIKHDKEAKLRTKPKWHREEKDPSKLGPLAAALESYLAQFRPLYPISLASERQFLEGLKRQLEKWVPDLYGRMESEVKTFDLTQIRV